LGRGSGDLRERAENYWRVALINVGNISGDRTRGDGPTPVTNTTSHDVTCCELGLGQGSRLGEVDASIQAGAHGDKIPGAESCCGVRRADRC